MDDCESDFLSFARNGDIDEIKELLSSCHDFNINCKGKSKSNRGWTALHLASYFGHLDAVSYLLVCGADPDVTNSVGDTPLHRAAFTSREAVVHKLLEYNADVFIRNDERKKPSDVACNTSVKSILQAAEQVQSSKLSEKIFTAAKDGNVEVIENVLTSHPDIVHANTQDDLGNTPLHYAAMRDNRSVAVYLLHHGGDSSIANKEGVTAIDVSKTDRMKRLLDVQPIQYSAKTVQRFEGFLYRRRFMRLRLQWVVLEKGVMSYFARHADAVTGSKRKIFKYLTNAAVTVKQDNNNAFQIEFFDNSVHHLEVKKCPEASVSRQKWVHAIQMHIDYSSHYARVGKLEESDSDDDEIMPLVNVQNAVETGLAHNQLLKKQIDEFGVAVHKMAVSDSSQSAQLLLGKCHHILSISNEVATVFSSCLKTLQRQDEVRRIQVDQEKEKTRVWQQAFEALAAEHHNLERTLSFQTPESLALMSSATHSTDGPEAREVNGHDRATSPSQSNASGGFVTDEDQFYDAFESEDDDNFQTSPRTSDDHAGEKQQMNDNLNNGSRAVRKKDQGRELAKNGELDKHDKQKKITHYEHKHREVHTKSGRHHSHVVDDIESVDETITTPQGTIKTHKEKKHHIEKEVRKKSLESLDDEPSQSSSSGTVNDSLAFQDCNDYIYRDRLPCVMISRDDFSMWSILKQCIGKELSKITMPVVFNEPLSFLERLCEYMEYTYLLKKASESTDSVDRIQYVAAFAVSALASQLGRVGKPYNPLLGETYEYERPDIGFFWVAEQVSHHPPISAFHASGTDGSFEFHGSVHPKLKFWGKSVEVEPKGVITVILNKHNETYTWCNPHCSVHNVVVGKPWIEQHGGVEIVNHSTKEKCVLNFKSHSWFKSDLLNKVEGYIIDPRKTKLRYLEGDWTKGLYSLTPEVHEKYKHDLNPQNKSGKERKSSVSSKADVLSSLEKEDGCNKIWEAEPRPSFSKEYYSFTSFAMTLNERKDGDDDTLPPTDAKRRPDIRCQENGDVDGAGEQKFRLEEKQRAARKVRNKTKEEWKPKWFRNEAHPVTEALDWIFDKDYSEREWSRCPDIF